VLLASVGSAAEDTKRGPVWLAPIVPRVRLDALLARVGAPLPLSDVAWERLHPRAARRMQTRMAILAMPAIGLSWPALGPWSLPLATIVLGLAFAAARRQAAAFGYARSSTLVAVKRGWLWRSVYISWIDRIQAVSVQASPFDRRHGMASVLVDTAAGAGQAGSLEIPYLDAPTAVRVAHDLAVDGALSQSGVNRPAHNDHNRQTLVSLLATSGTAGTALDPPERPPA
jgi:putative membrane protein